MDGSADSADSDNDGMSNWQEWVAGTDPASTNSVLQMLTPTNSGSGLMVCWTSVTNRTYFLERSTNLASSPAFSLLKSNLAGTNGVTAFPDTNVLGGVPVFYRVGVQQ